MLIGQVILILTWKTNWFPKGSNVKGAGAKYEFYPLLTMLIFQMVTNHDNKFKKITMTLK